MRRPQHHLLLLFLLLPLTLSAFLPSNLRGLYVRRIGSSRCPKLIQIESVTTSLPPSNISVNNQTCTSGALSFPSSPSTAPPPSGLLARYLEGTPQSGPFLFAIVTENLTCPERFFPPDFGFLFIAADQPFNVSWERVFENSDTELAQSSPAGDDFRFERGVQHLFISDRCMYDRIDIPPENRRACFPANAQVYLRDKGVTRMEELRVGDMVLVGKGEYSTVIMFSHRSREYGYVVELRVANRTIGASAGHLVRVEEGGLRRMGEIKKGMRVLLEEGRWGRVEEVRWAVRWGLYNPHTEKGEIVVDGVVCSCYTDAVSARVAHTLLAPVRAGVLWAMSIMGASS